jgi:hypothetical protein
LNRSSCERDTDNNSRNDIIKPYPIPTQNSEEPEKNYLERLLADLPIEPEISQVRDFLKVYLEKRSQMSI